MKKLEEKVDKILEDLTEIKVDIAETKVHLNTYNKQLEIHIKRSNNLEQKLDNEISDIADQLNPIRKHVVFVRASLWTLSVLAGITLGLSQLGVLGKLAAFLLQ